MFYYITKYNFDAGKYVSGPFTTEKEAWDAMKAAMQEEYRSDIEDRAFPAEITIDEQALEITIINKRTHFTDITESFVVEIPSNN